jgi:hypothetical protein
MKHFTGRLITAVLLLFSPLVSTVALETSIRESSGTAELLLPGEAARQAVSGRLVPVGATVAVWAGGAVVIARDDGNGQASVRITAGPLTVLTVTRDDQDLLTIALVAGGVSISTDGSDVAVTTGLATIESRTGEFSVAFNEVVLLNGTMTITYPDGKVRVIEEPGEISLEPTPFAPIFRAR